MRHAEFDADKNNPHRAAGNVSVECNALYKTNANFNCYLTPSQAIQHARNLLQKAQLILDNSVEDAVVHVWSLGKGNSRLVCGLNQAVKKRRTGKKAAG